jgi:structure-specific recognition protein 1/high mobility group protein B3
MARDKNAPKKPCTGYLNYANSIRAEVAAESGVRGVKNAAEFSRRWKALPEAEREKWNSEARAAIGAWKVQMDAYKQTDEYKQFQTNKTKKRSVLALASTRPSCFLETRKPSHARPWARKALLHAAHVPVTSSQRGVGHLHG